MIPDQLAHDCTEVGLKKEQKEWRKLVCTSYKPVLTSTTSQRAAALTSGVQISQLLNLILSQTLHYHSMVQANTNWDIL